MDYNRSNILAMDWIQGERFINIADFVFAPPNRSDEDYLGIVNTFDKTLLKDVNVVYTHTGYVSALFDEIDNIDKEFVIITHNSDVNVGNVYVPLNVRKWFTTNVNCSVPVIESIPIGLENDMWFTNIGKKTKMLIKLQSDKHIKNVLYVNHNPNTNIDKRGGLYEMFCDKSWVTAREGANGIGFDDYLHNIYNHKFVLCPEGNGMDTHRKWECLYMGTIPIEKRNTNNRFYTDLPICFVDDWEDITLMFLETEYDRITNGVWDKAKLYFNYWKNKIFSYAN